MGTHVATAMRFSTDGGITWQEAETVMVDVPPKPDDQQTLRVNVTPWGADVEVYDRTENEVQVTSQFHPWDTMLPKE